MKKTALILALAAVTAPVFAETELPQVVVTASNSEQSLKTVTSPTTIITEEEIKEKQAHSLVEVLRGVPGITIKSNGGPGTASTIFMRGQGNQGTLVLIDGIEMTNPLGTGGARIEMIPVADIQRIEIIQGPQSGVWGSGAAGVINIITKKSGANTASAEFGSYGFKQISTSFGAQTPKSGFRVNLSSLSTDGYSRIKAYHHSNDGYENDAFQQSDLSFSFHFKPVKNHQFSVFIKNTQAYSEYDSTYVTPPTTPPNANGSYDKTDFTDTLRRIGLKSVINEHLSSELYAQDNQLTHYGNEGLTTQTGGRLHFSYNDSDFLNLEIQNKNLHQLYSSKSYNDTSYSANNTNRFGQFVITEAIRQDDFNRFKDATTGKVGAKYLLPQEGYISANYGTAYNAPTLYQATYKSTQNLKPESSTGYDLTLSKFGATITYFKQVTEDAITFDYNTYDKYYNADGRNTAEGIEFSYQRTFEAISTDLKLSYLTQTVTNKEGDWLALRPDETANVQLSYFGFNKATIGIDTSYVGDKYDKSDKKGANIGNYFVTDLFANYALTRAVNLKAKVKNLFNEDYTDAVASYVGNSDTPKYVYNNGGTQIFVGIDGKF
ncbi:TonB-dependent receptor plug domain-containing protein [Galenea microaerophila]